MSNRSQMFEALLNAQSQMVESFTTALKKVPEIVGKGDAVQKSAELYRELFDKQRSIFEGVFSSLKDQVGSVDMVPDIFKGLVESTLTFSKGAFENIKDFSQNFSNAKGLELYQEQTEKIFTNLKETYEATVSKLGKPFDDLKFNPVDFVKDVNERMIETAKKYVAVDAKK